MNILDQAFVRIGGVHGSPDKTLHPLSEDEVLAIEDALAAPLPELYRTFLLTYGEIGFENLIFCPMLEPFPGRAGTAYAGVFNLHGSDLRDRIGVLSSIDSYRGRMPESMFSIGDDIFGNQICLGFADEDYDKIYFWDHEGEWTDWDEYCYLEGGGPAPSEVFDNLYLLANSFEDFLNRLEVRNCEEGDDA